MYLTWKSPEVVVVGETEDEIDGGLTGQTDVTTDQGQAVPELQVVHEQTLTFHSLAGRLSGENTTQVGPILMTLGSEISN